MFGLEKFSDVIPSTGLFVQALAMDLHEAAVPSSNESNSKRVARSPIGVDGKPPRGPLLSAWVGKVLGKPSVETPGNADDPITIPIDEEDDAVETGQAAERDETNVDVNDKVAMLESQIAHLERAPFQTSVFSSMVAQLEAELSAALVERRESVDGCRLSRPVPLLRCFCVLV